jgi:hypothetical protein
MWDRQLLSVKLATEMIDFLERSEGRWRVVNGRLQFDRQEEIGFFNAKVDEINRLGNEMEAGK